MSSFILVENIRKAETIILANNNNKQEELPDEQSLLSLWNSQVTLLRSEIEKAVQEQKIATDHNNVEMVIILDIEGTITPLYFVTKILFPFFTQNCAPFVKKHLSQRIFDLAKTATNQQQQQTQIDDSEFSSALEKSMFEVATEFIQHWR